MPCTVVLSGGDKLSFDAEPDEMANLLAPHKTGPNGFVKTINNSVAINFGLEGRPQRGENR